MKWFIHHLQSLLFDDFVCLDLNEYGINRLKSVPSTYADNNYPNGNHSFLFEFPRKFLNNENNYVILFYLTSTWPWWESLDPFAQIGKVWAFFWNWGGGGEIGLYWARYYEYSFFFSHMKNEDKMFHSIAVAIEPVINGLWWMIENLMPHLMLQLTKSVFIHIFFAIEMQFRRPNRRCNEALGLER